MKYLFYCFFFVLGIQKMSYSNNFDKTYSQPVQDSSVKERFIVNILNEYEQKGRWVFLKIVRCGNKPSFEIVEPLSLYQSLADMSTSLNKKQFISMAFVNLNEHGSFSSCPSEAKIYYPNASYEIQGRKVNMKQYAILNKMAGSQILKVYFDNNKFLKKKYLKIQNEIIAACYAKNIKVISLENGDVQYQVFK